MIQNPEILKKLEEKTPFDPTMRSFVNKLFESESEGKSLKKICETEIEKAIKKSKGDDT